MREHSVHGGEETDHGEKTGERAGTERKLYERGGKLKEERISGTEVEGGGLRLRPPEYTEKELILTTGPTESLGIRGACNLGAAISHVEERAQATVSPPPPRDFRPGRPLRRRPSGEDLGVGAGARRGFRSLANRTRHLNFFSRAEGKRKFRRRHGANGPGTT